MSDPRIISAFITAGFAFVGGLVGYGIAIWLQKKNEKSAERLQEQRGRDDRDLAILGLKFDKFNEFLDSEGLTELLLFFDDVKPSEITSYLEKISVLDTHFQAQKRQLDSINRLLDAALFNPVTGRIHRKIESNALFISRLNMLKDSKEYLMNHITGHEIVQDIIREKNTIFIESGSTLAYSMLKIIDDIQKYRPDCEFRPLRVCTNNISIYVILLFEKYFEPILLPGNPDNQYGATFSDASGDGLNDGQKVREFLEVHKVEALFTTASFVDIVYGPHVSSQRNQAVKRVFNQYANEYECENILVITSEKINNGVSEEDINENCKLIFAPKNTSSDLSDHEVLEKAKFGWEEHLRRPNNIFITGSHNKASCHSATDTLCETHPHMRHFLLDFDDGSIVKIYSGSV